MILLLISHLGVILILIWFLMADLAAGIRYGYTAFIWRAMGWIMLLADRILDLFFYGWKGYSVLIAVTGLTWFIIWTQRMYPELSRRGIKVQDILLFRKR